MSSTEHQLAPKSDLDIPELHIDQFKIADHLMSKEQKAIMKKLRARFKAINDEFLSHFEKKFIVFIEEGTDLIKDLNLFDRQLKFNEENSADGIIKQLEDTKKMRKNTIAGQPLLIHKGV